MDEVPAEDKTQEPAPPVEPKPIDFPSLSPNNSKKFLIIAAVVLIIIGDYYLFGSIIDEFTVSERRIIDLKILAFYGPGLYLLVTSLSGKLTSLKLKLSLQTVIAAAITLFFLLNTILLGLMLIADTGVFEYFRKQDLRRAVQKVDSTKPTTVDVGGKDVPKNTAKSYVYWVHLKGAFESGCCGVANPSRPTPDESYIFKLADKQDRREYEGVVCSPECNEKNVVWSGPAVFLKGDGACAEDYSIKLTPTGPVRATCDDQFNERHTYFYEVIVKKRGCQEDSCIVKRKIIATYLGDLILDAKDNINELGEYDVYICNDNCDKNPPRQDWNPRRCVAKMGSNLILSLADRDMINSKYIAGDSCE